MTEKAPHVLICTPCYGGLIHQGYHISTLQLMTEVYSRKEINVSFSIRGGDSLITRLRNSMTAEFLADDKYTHMLFIDADVTFTPDEIFKLIHSGHDVATGCYPLKVMPLPDQIPTDGKAFIDKNELFAKYMRYPWNPLRNQRGEFQVHNDFTEVLDAPTGMMAIKREVFEKMIDSYPDLKYQPDTQFGMEALHEKISDCYYNFFDTFLVEDQFPDGNGGFIKKKRYLSEDYAFCRLWQNIGGKIHLYTQSKLNHTGTYTFAGDFERFLQLNFGIQPLPEVVQEIVPMAIPSLDATKTLNTPMNMTATQL